MKIDGTLQEEIKFVNSRHTPINDRSRTWIAISISSSGLSGEKSCVVTFAADHDSQFRSIRTLPVEFPKGGPNRWKFFCDHNRELSLGDKFNGVGVA
jgi:hypothetical protein